MMLKVLFWFFVIVICYSYIGYTLVLIVFKGINKLLHRKREVFDHTFEPEISLLIPAYNEAEIIDAKMQNCLDLDYPREKLQIIWITDGSTDGSPDILKQYKNIRILHNNTRKGKVNAINRGMKEITTPFVIFSDANTILNTRAIREMIGFFSNPKVGCVAGEKRITVNSRQEAAGSGEGIYWRYESYIKSLESETGSVLGAVGELFAIRRDLFKKVDDEVLLDDLTISMNIAKEGYLIKYAPNAWSYESASFSISDELKRKIRIAIGGFQFLHHNAVLLNPFKNGILSMKYMSHKVIRWTFVPLGFIVILLTNTAVVMFSTTGSTVFHFFLGIQAAFYLTIIAGAWLKNKALKYKYFFIPYYLFIMNYAMIIGFIRYLQGKYSSNWPKAKRA